MTSTQQQQLDAVLQRIDKQSSLCRQPPNSVGAALGRKLAACCVLRDDDENSDTKMLQTLCRPNINPATVNAFFDHIVADGSRQTVSSQRLGRWMLTCEEIVMADDANLQHNNDTTYTATTTCITRAFARLLRIECEEEDFDDSVILSTLQKLQTPPFRISLLRECVSCAFSATATDHDDASMIIRMISPCMAAGVLSVNNISNSDERLLFLQSLYGQCWAYVRTNHAASSSGVRILHWLAKSLHLFQQTMIHSSSVDKQVVMIRRETGRQWCLELVGMMEILSEKINKEQQEIHQSFERLVSFVLESVLLSCYDNDTAILQRFVRIQGRMKSSINTPRRVLFDVAVNAMTTASPEQTRILLELLGMLTDDSKDAFVQGILHSLSCILPGMVANRPSTDGSSLETTSVSEPKSLVDLFQTNDDVERVLGVMGHSLEHLKSELSPSHQNQALLIGTALRFASPTKKESIQGYLQILTRRFPHLGISLMPVLFQSIYQASGTNLNGQGFDRT